MSEEIRLDNKNKNVDDFDIEIIDCEYKDSCPKASEFCFNEYKDVCSTRYVLTFSKNLRKTERCFEDRESEVMRKL